jgi:hypothetical protein
MDKMKRSKLQVRITNQPKAWWQRALAGERPPKNLFKAKSKCEGTVEDHRNIALDARELTRKQCLSSRWARFFISSCVFLGCV